MQPGQFQVWHRGRSRYCELTGAIRRGRRKGYLRVRIPQGTGWKKLIVKPEALTCPCCNLTMVGTSPVKVPGAVRLERKP